MTHPVETPVLPSGRAGPWRLRIKTAGHFYATRRQEKIELNEQP